MRQHRGVDARTGGNGVTMTEHAVVIAGGGPTGLMLAGELALAGVDVAIVERRASQALAGSRAGGLSSRTIEVLDQRGIADRFLAEGQVAQVTAFAPVHLDISDFPTRHNYGLALWQNHIERILADWVGELAVTIYRRREVTGFAQDDTGVDVALSDGQSLRAQYLVGCDGGRSLVRKAAGIEFPGWNATTSALLAEVEMAEEPELGMRPQCFWRPFLGQGEVRDPRRRSDLQGGGDGTGHGDRTARRTHERTHPARSQRGSHCRIRDRLRDPQSHALLGRRMPDLDLVTANSPLRVFTLLHDARPVLLNLGEPGGFDITPWADRVQLIDAKYDGTWELPAIGPVTAPTAMLIRPDGYVAWVGDSSQLGLADALTTWFGPPTAA
jgi:2-polyprenyl-6-methoxyphenol hydroxylase-like FAD-dependent oxidoreductase